MMRTRRPRKSDCRRRGRAIAVPLPSRAVKPERAALARFALDRDLASHQLGQLLGDRQSESRAAIFAGGRGVGLLEGLEQALDLRLAHADAGIAHGKLDELAVGGVLQNANLDRDLALLGELDGVVAEIDQDLTEPERIAAEMGRDRGLDLEDQLEPLGRGLLAHQVADILQHLVEIEVDVLDRQFAGLDLREIENVVDDAEQVLAGALDLLHVVALARREVGLQREMGEADDGVHRRPDLVAHIGEEDALGLACLERRRGRFLQLGLRPLGFELGRLAGVDIAPRADHLDRVAVTVADEMLLVADPDIGAVLLAEAVLGQVLAVFEQLDLLRLDLGEVVGMNVGPPEVGRRASIDPGYSPACARCWR